jgi:MFS family permease
VKAFDVLWQWNYGIYTAGSTISLLGLWAHKLAAAWLAWELTGSSFWVGAVAFADLAPSIVLTPYAGVIADRYDRRTITLVSQVFGMLQAFVIGWMVLAGKFTRHDDIWWLLGLTLFLGVVWAFNTAARLSMVPNPVEHRFIPPAIALNSAIFNLARVIGPAIAGPIMAFWGVGEAFLFNGATFVVFIVSLLFVDQVRTEERLIGRGGALAQSLEGFVYARRHPPASGRCCCCCWRSRWAASRSWSCCPNSPTTCSRAARRGCRSSPPRPGRAR